MAHEHTINALSFNPETYHKGSVYVEVPDGTLWEIRACKEHDITGVKIVNSPFADDKWLPSVEAAKRRIQRQWGGASVND